MGSGGAAVAGGICTIAVLSAIPIAMIVLGTQHMDDCPMEPWIPKCMVVGGAATLVLFLCILLMLICGAMDSKGGVLFCTVLVVLLALFLFGWQIASSYWVFKEWSGWGKVKDDVTKGCHKDTYLFIFSLLIIYWVTCPCQGGGSKLRDNN